MAMGVWGQLGASLTGCIEPAKILIYDYRGSIQAKENEFTSNIATSVRNGKRESENAQAAVSRVNKGSLAKMAKFRRKAISAENNGSTFEKDPSKTKTFTVHFNPSKLQIYSSSSSSNKSDVQGGSPAQDATHPGNLSMTVSLYFDEMNVYDSFMVDKFTMGASVSGVTNAVSAVAKNGFGKTWSVRDEVEGFVGALRNPYTRHISFRWADFTFTGQLNTVNAQYTMFSTSGEPVRALVTLRIQHEMDCDHLDRWFKEYDNATMGKTRSLTKASQYVGNIVNFNL